MSADLAELRCTTCDRPATAPQLVCPWCGGDRLVEYAGVWARLGAWVLDAIFVWAAVLFVGFVVLDNFDVPFWTVFVGAFTASWVWHAAWIASGDGATPGHRIAGFGVRRRRTLEHVTFGRALGREVIKTLTIVIGNGIKVIGDIVMISATDRRQSLHDMALDTVCIKERYFERPTSSHAVEALGVDAPHLDAK